MIPVPETDDPRDMAAARWAVRLEAGSLAPEQQAELDLWLSADIRHSGALARARAGLLVIDRLAALAGPALDPGSSVGGPSGLVDEPAGAVGLGGSVDGPAGAVRSGGSVDEPGRAVGLDRSAARSRRLARLDRRWVLAAGLCATIAGAVLSIAIHLRAEHYESGAGELRRVALVDGSQLQLDAESSATVRFSRELREIRLDRGEAMFRVAKDKRRPFVVHAGGLNVRAVGTAFAVRTESGSTEVSVAEGVVEVWREGDERATQRVHALERAVAGNGSQVVVAGLTVAAMRRDLAWEDGLVSFNGERLDAAIAQINRRSRVKLNVTDPVLAAQPVVGVFQSTDAVGFASAVCVAVGAQATRQGETIYLQPGVPNKNLTH